VEEMERQVNEMRGEIQQLHSLVATLVANIKSSSDEYPFLGLLLNDLKPSAPVEDESKSKPKAKASKGARALYAPHLWCQIIVSVMTSLMVLVPYCSPDYLGSWL
jgi:hypothetical protein